MKVKCIKNNSWKRHLTIDKIYDAIYIDNDYKIIDDIYEEWRYPKEWFKSLSEIRNEKIDKLLDDENKMYKK
jgi:hypothetical protein